MKAEAGTKSHHDTLRHEGSECGSNPDKSPHLTRARGWTQSAPLAAAGCELCSARVQGTHMLKKSLGIPNGEFYHTKFTRPPQHRPRTLKASHCIYHGLKTVPKHHVPRLIALQDHYVAMKAIFMVVAFRGMQHSLRARPPAGPNSPVLSMVRVLWSTCSHSRTDSLPLGMPFNG